MSMTKRPSILDAVDFDARPIRWDNALTRFTRRRRQKLGLSQERAAELAGMELSQWCALESGWAPDDMGLIQAIAATLETSWSDYSFLALMADCQQMGRPTIQ